MEGRFLHFLYSLTSLPDFHNFTETSFKKQRLRTGPNIMEGSPIESTRERCQLMPLRGFLYHSSGKSFNLISPTLILIWWNIQVLFWCCIANNEKTFHRSGVAFSPCNIICPLLGDRWLSLYTRHCAEWFPYLFKCQIISYCVRSIKVMIPTPKLCKGYGGK